MCLTGVLKTLLLWLVCQTVVFVVSVNEMPVLKADAIKYVMIFRNQLPRNVILMTLPHIVNLLTAQNQVVHTYAAHAIEKILMLRLSDGTAR